MVKILLKKQLAEIFRSYFYDAKKNKARSKAATIGCLVGFAVLMVGVLGALFTGLSLSMCQAMSEAGMDWLYFALMSLLSIFLGAFGSVFNTYSGLYLSKDNDLLLSMPIPVSAIMTARLLGVYLMGLMYSGIVILPAVIVYWFAVSMNAAVVAGSLLLVALISIFVLTLSCALGWVVAKISLKLKNKSFITVLVSLVFFGAYYFFYFKAQTAISDLVANAIVYGERIKGAAYPVYLMGRVALGDGAAMAIVSAAVLALFALTWAIISRSFLRIATATGQTGRRVYREKAARRRGVGSALLEKELSRFTGSANYMLNCGMGVLLLLAAGVALLLKGGMLIEVLDAVFAERPGCAQALLCAGICAVASMNDMTAPSVSLEGKSLYLLQSLPLTPWQALRAKLQLQVLLTGVPCAVCMVCLLFVCPFTVPEAVAAFLAVGSTVLLLALFGLYMGVKMPSMNWTSEITPIKQSAPVMFALLSGWLYALLLGGGYLLFGHSIGFAAYAACFGAVTLLLSGALYAWLRGRGSARFAAL